jgi:hypothetical protein
MHNMPSREDLYLLDSISKDFTKSQDERDEAARRLASALAVRWALIEGSATPIAVRARAAVKAAAHARHGIAATLDAW